MECPRCKAPISSLPDPGGFILCPGCGVRLMARADALRTAGGTTSNGPAAAPPKPQSPSATLPPGTPLKKIPRLGEDTARSGKVAKKGDEKEAGKPAEKPKPPASPDAGAAFERVLDELEALRRGQEQILALLRAGAGPHSAAEPLGSGFEERGALAPVRSSRRKVVLVIDDDPATREATVAEFKGADVAVRGVADGGSGIQAIAEDKPDVIALELALQGPMSGTDVINQIKATMEWVDIPIILYTRENVESQKEARQVHGADDLVLKRSGPAALVSRVITAFRRPA
jgi:CheY-like chemotaxis protein